MLRTLLVPLDGSALAERALPYAVRLARVGHGRLILMRAALGPPPRTLDGSEWESDQADAVDEAEEYLRKVAFDLADKVPVECAVLYGRAAGQIQQAICDYHADAVVMATHGRTGLPHLLYGSVTEEVLASSAVPVLAVYARPGEAPEAAAMSPYHARVLVPQDGSANDVLALRTALEMLGDEGDIVLVGVVPPAEHVEYDQNGHVLAYLDQQEEARRLEARDYLNGVVDDLRPHHGITVKVDVRVGDPASRIALAAIEEGVDLVVMATHARTGLRRAVVGSVAGTVLRSTPTPVLLVHPTATEATTTGEPLIAAPA
jgi:nucleotide-binding universal stress UspA family protein